MPQNLLELNDAPAWDCALSDFEFVPPGQTASWSAARNLTGDRVLRFLSARRGAVAAQGVLRRAIGLDRFVVENGPIIGRTCDESTFLDFAEGLRDRLGAHCAIEFSSVQPHDAENELWLRKAGFKRPCSMVLSPMTLYVACSSPDATETGFRHDWRKNIRKAERAGITIDVAPLADEHARADLLSIYSETFRIKQAAADLDGPVLSALAPDRRWNLYFASYGGKRVSARLVFVSGQVAFDVAAGTTAEGRDLSASNFVMASIFRILGSSGVRWFDFGRIGPGRFDSIDHFKRGSGGRPVTYLGEWSASSHDWLEPALAVVRFIRRRDRW